MSGSARSLKNTNHKGRLDLSCEIEYFGQIFSASRQYGAAQPRGDLEIAILSTIRVAQSLIKLSFTICRLAKCRASRAAEQAMKLIATERVMRQMVAPPERRTVCRFPAWAQNADRGGLAKAATSLARAYLRNNLPDHLRRGAKAAFIAIYVNLLQDAEV
jgi:hypothetical protein